MQHYRYKTCSVAFCETTGTIFHGRRKLEQKIIETLVWLDFHDQSHRWERGRCVT